jgi:hypothetical protein
VDCENPCPDIFPDPRALGFDGTYSQSSIFTWSVDITAIMTALAINMHITPLANLERFDNDTKRIDMIHQLQERGLIDPISASKVSSYFELLFAPTEPIYW